MEYTHELFTWKFCQSVCENKLCTYLNVYLMYMYFKWCMVWRGILYLYFSFVDVFVFSCSYIIFTNVLICPLAKSEIPKLFPLYPSNQVAWVFYIFVWWSTCSTFYQEELLFFYHAPTHLIYKTESVLTTLWFKSNILPNFI